MYGHATAHDLPGWKAHGGGGNRQWNRHLHSRGLGNPTRMERAENKQGQRQSDPENETRSWKARIFCNPLVEDCCKPLIDNQPKRTSGGRDDTSHQHNRPEAEGGSRVPTSRSRVPGSSIACSGCGDRIPGLTHGWVDQLGATATGK